MHPAVPEVFSVANVYTKYNDRTQAGQDHCQPQDGCQPVS